MPHRGTDFRGEPEVGVAACLGEGRAAYEYARSRHQTLVHRFTEPGVNPSGVSHGGKPLIQGLFHDLEGLYHEHRGEVLSLLVDDVGVHGPEMDVGVDESRQKCLTLAVYHQGVGRDGSGFSGAHFLDALFFDDHESVGNGIGTAAVNYGCIFNYDRFRG